MRRQLVRRLGLNRLHLTEGRPIVLNEERRRAILELVNSDGRVLVPELARHFDTSQVTIRKDLEVLHNLRKLYRTHGGRCQPAIARWMIPACGKKSNSIARKSF